MTNEERLIELERENTTMRDILRGIVAESPRDDDYSDCTYCGSGEGELHQSECAWYRAQQFIEGVSSANPQKTELGIIEDFYNRVCRRAEANMQKSHRLEGAHYAAMCIELKELRLLTEHKQ